MAYADQRAADGLDRWRTRKIDARLATIEDDLDSGTIGGGGGGSDPWTYVSLGSDFTTTSGPSGGDVDVTDLVFTPAANKQYEIEGRFFLRATQTTTGPQVGVAWPSAGVVEPSACRIVVPSTANTDVHINLPRSTNGRVATQGSISTSLEMMGLLWAVLSTDGSASGTFQITLRSETNTFEVRMVAGSFIRYREIPTS